ncbi:hypothetical protein PAMP_005780 [Pampus punctatissimus]
MKRLTQSTVLQAKTQTGNTFIIMHQRLVVTSYLRQAEGTGQLNSCWSLGQAKDLMENHVLMDTRMASCGSCFWCLIWLVILLFIGWPLGITLGGLYGLISPLTTCLGLDRLSDLLLEGANLGRTSCSNWCSGKKVKGQYGAESQKE